MLYKHNRCSMKSSLKEKVINLRKQGLSYSEILKQIPVAKSTVSLWLRSINLSKKQKQRLTEKKKLSSLRGAQKKKDLRILLTKKIYDESKKDIKTISKRDLFILGIALYWAEGSKEKENHYGSGVRFSNSDPEMIKLFVKWLKDIGNVQRKDIYFDIYLHENSKNNVKNIKKFWSNSTGFPLNYFSHVYFKKIKSIRKEKIQRIIIMV